MTSIVDTPDTQATTPAEVEVAELLRRIDSWPSMHVERQSDRMTFRVRDVVIGTLNLGTRTLSVDLPSDTVRRLVSSHPQLVAMKDSVSLRLTDTDSRTAAESLLRWRTTRERFTTQLRAASP